MESGSGRYGRNTLRNVAAMIGVPCSGGSHGAQCSRFASPRITPVGDQLVIVDPEARRVVAIVPNIG